MKVTVEGFILLDKDKKALSGSFCECAAICHALFHRIGAGCTVIPCTGTFEYTVPLTAAEIAEQEAIEHRLLNG